MNKNVLPRVALGLIAILAVALLVGTGSSSGEPHGIVLGE
jgi:hypothetical protein